MLIILFIGAAIVKVLNISLDNAFYTGSTKTLYYLDAFYYMIITAATIGYGDIYPNVFTSRIIMLAMILSVFAVFGENISKIGSVMRETNFENRYYKLRNHIVILGTL
jgi:hypothetical protein